MTTSDVVRPPHARGPEHPLRFGPPAHRARDPRPALYDRALLSRRPGRAAGGGWWIRDAGGRVRSLSRALDRWVGPLDPADRTVADRCAGPALDVGCGPGRMVAGLRARGVDALGVDLSPAAVALTRERGGAALQADVFGPLPGEGNWGEVLLLDGNVGLGGDPQRLLGRCRRLLATGGTVLVELSAPGARPTVTQLRVESDTETGPWFPWATLSVDSVRGCAIRARLRVGEVWSEGARWFAALTT